ncbi:MAG TPA: helix-turn-helix transcriptional regulator [Pseudonocardiaceae bacterium]|jgi:AraC-like DNA-binding protein|nr:helix-turn-helix transcriptional regulator [Pseudonocardiaceae bacterium]
MTASPDESMRPVDGALVVRASGASAALAAVSAVSTGAEQAATNGRVQVAVRVAMPRRLAPNARRLVLPGCTVELLPPEPGDRSGVVVVTIDAHRLTIALSELQPLMFRPVTLRRPLEVLFGSAVEQLLLAGAQADLLDEHGGAHHVAGLVELLLRSALRDELNQVDTGAARYRDAVAYISEHLADPELTAERVADALFISRRRLYQLFTDGDGVSGRIRRMRIERAKQLLADPTRAKHGVGDIARQCGFVNAAHFSRTFRGIVGRTPKEFRQRGSVAEVDRGHELPEQG